MDHDASATVRASTLVLLACLTLTGCIHATRPHRDDRSSRAPARVEAEEEKKGPTNWFLNQRRSVDGSIPPLARALALEEFQATARPALVAPPTWTNVGPRNVGGRVTGLAVDPNAPTHLWLAAAAGGVWTSTDSGTNWTSVFDSQTALSIGAIAVHPTDSNTVWVGTGEDNGGGYSYDGEGIFKTIDGGASWSNMGLANTRRIGKIVIDPANGQRVFAAAGGDWFHKDTNRGIYRSVDGGASWQQVLFVGNDTGGIDLAIDPSNVNRIYAAVWQRFSAGDTWYIGGAASGIYRSLDGGTNWTKLTAGLPAVAGRIGIAIAPSAPTTLYASISSASGTLDGIYKSTNSGDTWIKVSGASVPNQFSTYTYYFSQIRVDPTNVNTVYALDVNLLKSTNGGVSWVSAGGGVHVDWHDLIVEASGRWLCGTDGGFYRGSGGGASFVKAVTLPITQLYDLGICRPNPAFRVVGAQDNNSQRTTTGGASDWVSILGGDGLQTEVDPDNCNRLVASAQYGTIYRSTNGGAGMEVGYDGIDPNDRTNWNAPVVLDPRNSSVMYTATYRVYRSTDFADNWTAISGDLSNGHPSRFDDGGDPAEDGDLAHLQNLIDGTITVIAVSKFDSTVLWAGTDDGNVWVSANTGGNWTQVNPPGFPYWVTDIETSPFDAQTAYLTVTGYRQGDKLPYVRVTRDLGQTWDDLSGGLPQVPVSAILPSLQWRGRLFVGNDLGVLMSDDDGLTWSDLRTGLPYVVVMDLVENTPTDTLFAATHARSIYTLPLDALPPADGDGDGVDNNADCALADAGAFAAPAEVATVRVEPGEVTFAGSESIVLSWSTLAPQAGSAIRYDVAIGDLADLGTLGTPAATAVLCSTASLTASDTTPLAPGQGVYYLVRARNACGLGTWGTNSAEVARVLNACP